MIDFEDAPIGDTPDLDPAQFAPAPPAIPSQVVVNDGTWDTMWNGFQRLSALLEAAPGASIFDRAADEIEALRRHADDLADLLTDYLDAASGELE